MTQYLLSIYQPDGPPPPPEVLQPIVRDVTAVADEMKKAGAWVFSAGLHEAGTATVVRAREGQTVMTDGRSRMGRSTSAGSPSSRRRTSIPRSTGPRSCPGPRRSPSRCAPSSTEAGNGEEGEHGDDPEGVSRESHARLFFRGRVSGSPASSTHAWACARQSPW